MTKHIYAILFTIISALPAFAQQENIVIGQGFACMGQSRSRDDTRKIAYENAKMSASEAFLVRIEGSSEVINGKLTLDKVNTFSANNLQVIKVIDEGWFKDKTLSGTDDLCYSVKIKAMATTPSNRTVTRNTSPSHAPSSKYAIEKANILLVATSSGCMKNKPYNTGKCVQPIAVGEAISTHGIVKQHPGWYAILMPDGSFAYIKKTLVAPRLE